MDQLTEWSCAEFTAHLAARESVPGGGGAAALVGAVGVALGRMAAVFTQGKPKFAAAEPQLTEICAQAEQLRQRLLGEVQADAELFLPLSQAYGLPTATEEQRSRKQQLLEAALWQAAGAPLKVMRGCAEALELLEQLLPICSRLLVSDVGCAAACCRAALCAAYLNVAVNTRSMQQRERAQSLDAEARRLLDQYTALADRIFAAVQAELA